MQADLGSSEIARKCQDDTSPLPVCFKNLDGNSSTRTLPEISLY